MKDSINTIAMGITGAAGTEIVGTMPDLSQMQTISQIVIQIIIGIVTLFHLHKANKPKTPTNT